MENKKINKFAIYIGYVLVLIGSFFGGLYITKLFFLIPWVFFVFDCLYEFAFSYRSKDYVKTLIITIILILSIVIIVFLGINIFDLGCNRRTTKCSNAICPAECKPGICDCFFIDEDGQQQIVQCNVQ